MIHPPPPIIERAAVAQAPADDLRWKITHVENTLLLEQMADVATTQISLHQPCWTNERFLRDGRWMNKTCEIRESDPLARPFVHSPVTNVASALALNEVVRLIPPSRMKLTVLRALTVLYPFVPLHNVRVMFEWKGLR